jgi:hypothetical protein
MTALAVAWSAACADGGTPGVNAPRPELAPRVLITIVVDQVPAWMAAERWSLLPKEGGFARLAREGLTVRELRYEHAATDTAPGHAALYTGEVPRGSGLYANETLGPDGKPRSILLDERTRLVDLVGAVIDRPGSSLAALRPATLADVLVAERPGARVYSFSLKDRGALPAAGRRPTVALWLDVPSGTFVTSTAFALPPPWAAPLADRAAVAAARADGWALDEADGRFVAEHAETTDDQDGEGDYDGLGRVFPHAVPSTKAMRATPIGDRVLFALARAALDEIGAGAAKPGEPPALLALSLSSNDYVEHVFGPHSWEAWAELVELDRRLGTLLADADRAVGPGGYAVMLTSDHGGGALPEVAADVARTTCREETPVRPTHGCGVRRRIMPLDAVTAFEEAAEAELGAGPWVAGFADPLVTLTARGKALDPARREKLRDAAASALRKVGVDGVYDARSMPATCAAPPDDHVDALVCNSVLPSGPGDFYLATTEGAFFDPDLARGFGQNHGGPYLEDRAVPLLVRAPGRVPAGVVREAPVSYAAFARTAAALLGVRPPAGARAAEDLTGGR